MRILFTADLHLTLPTGASALEKLRSAIETENPEAVIVAGDIGSPQSAATQLRRLRNVVENRTLAICLGNHDHWVPEHLHNEYSTLKSVREEFWVRAAKDSGITLLDTHNLTTEEVVLVGGYGHFDLGHAVPGLKLQGVTITEELYLSTVGPRIWNDFRFIPNCSIKLHEEAKIQAAQFKKRLASAIETGKRVLVATHTCPFRELNGHPLRKR